MRDLILSLRRIRSTVIFSSHILPDAEALCDRVGILAGGKIREVVTLQPTEGTSAYVLTIRNVDSTTLEQLEQLALQQPVSDGDSWNVRLPGSEAVGSALEIVRQAAGSVERLTPVHHSLEERFLSYVGHGTTLD